ncbi:MAG TPA: heavy-metal-associated domain-containing protein [Thermoanaerobaculia bacterium]|nr:heavy-metal-associated domain-containing protein [Thermoanaerobaculia bacterium]
MATTTLRIDGMSCDHCVRALTAVLKQTRGVTSTEISLERGTAVIEHATEVSTNDFVRAIEEEGYTAFAG